MRAALLTGVLSGLLVVAAAEAFAQSTTAGAIAGIVKDTTGAVLPGVTVEAASPALIEKVRSVVTDSEGQYKIVDLRPGTYTITFSLPGFSTLTRPGIELSTGFTATVNVEMKVGSVDETITVSGASPIVDTQNVVQQMVLSRQVLDSIPIQKNPQAFAAVTLGATVPTNRQDVGGSTGEFTSTVAIHGINGTEATMKLSGTRVDAMIGNGGGASRWYKPNQLLVEEITLQTGGISAESETGGWSANVVPKAGGNTYHFTSLDNYTGTGLQSDNVTPELRNSGLATTPKEKRISDLGFELGGFLKKDRLWFDTAHRWWRTDEQQAGNYYNSTPQGLFYTPDVGRPGVTQNYVEDHSLNVTWQATPKQKVTGFYSYQDACACVYGIAGAARAADAGLNIYYKNVNLASVQWNYPVTNKVLVEAGGMFLYTRHEPLPVSPADASSHAITNLATGLAYGAYEAPLNSFTAYVVRPDGTIVPNVSSSFNTNYAVSYVTGSHAMKVGATTRSGYVVNSGSENTSYQFINKTPVSLTLYASPQRSESRVRLNLGFYAQDQWTLSRLTLNLGVRFDYLNAYDPAQVRPGGDWVNPLTIPEQDHLPNWKDLSPRLGAAYDLFGTGRTAIKASLGQYVSLESTSIALTANPANAMVTSTSRTWNDANGNYLPDCDLHNPLANGECGPDSNRLFGTVNVNTRYADAVLNGFGVRPKNWQFNTALQQQLWPGAALNVAYYHTWNTHLFVTANQAIDASSYGPFCITAPADPRLPGGGGNQVCGFNDVSPTQFGRVSNLITDSSNYGRQTQVYDGIDAGLNARLPHGGQLNTGLSTGRSVADACGPAKAYPQVTATMTFASGAFTTGPSASTQFCRVTLPLEGQTQVKVAASYPLPIWGLQTAATLQNLPGIPITASYVATNAQIAPSLGRNLGQCGAAATCSGTVTIANVFAPNTQFGDRLTQVDARLSKRLQIGKLRMTGMFDIYNLFNVSTVLAVNTRYGSSWLQPLAILPGRLFKFGAQVDF
jgi:hypothetical protein